MELIRGGVRGVGLQWPVLGAWLPEGATAGVELVVDQHPLRIFHFREEKGGEDWALCKPHSLGRGCLAAASFPEVLYTDAAHQKRLPEVEIAWAPLVESVPIGEILDQARGPAVARSTLPRLPWPGSCSAWRRPEKGSPGPATCCVPR